MGSRQFRYCIELLKLNRILMQNTNKKLLKVNSPVQIQTRVVSTNTMDTYELKKAALSLSTPLEDYRRLIKEKVEIKAHVDDDILENNFRLIAQAARETVWKLLFNNDAPPTTENARMAAGLLEEYKRDACFYSPDPYNEWIKTVRDELLKREMIDFWRDCIVRQELGPCWARDSDLYENMDDPAPAEFYNHAGCVAPFLKKTDGDAASSTTSESHPPMPTFNDTNSADSDDPPVKISLETPVQDYTRKVNHQNSVGCDDDEAFQKIFEEAQQVIWKLLFTEDESEENFEKAAALLEEYKQDACFILPHAYNEWIVKLRDELFVRKRFDFWQKVIVDKQCGLCWYQDSDHFDDREDTRPIQFYKSGEKLMHDK